MFMFNLETKDKLKESFIKEFLDGSVTWDLFSRGIFWGSWRSNQRLHRGIGLFEEEDYH